MVTGYHHQGHLMVTGYHKPMLFNGDRVS